MTLSGSDRATGNQYRAVLTNRAGQFTTAAATLTVNGVPGITQQPVARPVAANATATFIAAAKSNAAATVQWQVSTNKALTYTPLAGETSATWDSRLWLPTTASTTRPSSRTPSGSTKTKGVVLTVGPPHLRYRAHGRHCQ